MKTPVGLVRACEDDALLGGSFRLWPGQKALLQSVEDGLRSAVWLTLWCIGRRAGKSTLAALVALWCCLLRPDLDELAGGSGRSYAVIVATNIKQARLVVAMAAQIIEASPLLSSMVERVSLDEILFTNGTGITSFPASSRGGRGRAIRCLVLDEAGHMISADTGPGHEAEAIYTALLPSVSQFGGRAPVIVSSTPSGDTGWFASMVIAGRAGELEHGQVVTATSADVNPTLDAAFLAAEQRRDPDGYRGEYLAELVGSGGAFIDAELIADAVAGRGELDPGDADGWIAGIDPSFTKDPFGLCIVGRDRANRDRLLLGLARSWPPPKGRAKGPRGDRHQLEDRILNEACDVLERFRVKTVVTDNYMAQTVHEALRRRGFVVESLVLTTGTKLEMFAGLKARLSSGTLELYDQPVLLAELRRLRSSFRGGARQVETPRLQGTHCDLAIALGLAVHELDRHGPAGRGMPRVDERDRGEPRASLTHDLFSRVF